MKQLIVIGARPFGREVCNFAREAGWTVKGFLDSDPNALGAFHGYPPILESPESYVPASNDVFVCAVGDSKMREKFVTVIERKNGLYANVIHPTAYIGRNVKMGVGCIVGPHAVVDCDLTLGNHVDVNSLSYVPHDCRLEDFVTLSPGCRLGGRTTVRSGAFLGLGAVVIPDIEVGPRAYVAAGAVVIHDVPEGAMVAGVPAKIIRTQV